MSCNCDNTKACDRCFRHADKPRLISKDAVPSIKDEIKLGKYPVHLKGNLPLTDRDRKLGVISKYERKDDKQPPKAEPVMIEVWLYHPDIMSRVGEYAYLHGHLHIVTKDGLVPYPGSRSSR